MEVVSDGAQTCLFSAYLNALKKKWTADFFQVVTPEDFNESNRFHTCVSSLYKKLIKS